MGTIPRPRRAAIPLPPPPAPTSHDANPWEMSAHRTPPRLPGLRVDPSKLPGRPGVPPAPASPSPQSGPQRQSVRLRWLPFAIIGGVFIAVGGNALESMRRGDYIGALVPLVFVGFIAFGAVRTLLRKRS